jgi:hypothetical protein
MIEVQDWLPNEKGFTDSCVLAVALKTQQVQFVMMTID